MVNINFSDTQTAFEIKTDKDLKKAVFLFNLINKKFFVKFIGLITKIALKIGIPVGWAVKPTVYKHFVGGETIESCKLIIEKYQKHNVKIILDYSVESGKTETQINAALEETLKTIENSAKSNNIPFVVFKPTALCFPEILEKASKNSELNENEIKEIEKFRGRVKKLCQKAFELDIPILVDAEHVAYQNIIDKIVYEMMLLFNKQKAIVYNTLQMYRKDRTEYLQKIFNQAVADNIFLGLKFVRGTYMEHERKLAAKNSYPDPIHSTKEETDNAFNNALEFSVEHIDKISIFNATHNEKSTLLLAELMEKHSIPKNDKRCYFSQLYGMSDNISFNLAKLGYNVAKYTPYGPIKQVLPYLLRRVHENTSVAGQTSRELLLLSKEQNRRKEQKK